MFKELDEYLLGQFTIDYWYDEGVEIASDIIKKFDKDDWIVMLDNMMSKPIDWQIRYAYCIDSDTNNEFAIKSIILLSNIDNDELFETCVDSLRVLCDSDSIGVISDEKEIIQRIEGILPKCGKPSRKIFEDFIKKVHK